MSDEDWGFIDNMLAEMFIRSEVLTRVRGCFCNIHSGEVMRVEETAHHGLARPMSRRGIMKRHIKAVLIWSHCYELLLFA